MATAFRATTPPPPSSPLRVPPTPKHGWEDDYQPYSPRKSARISDRRSRAAQTPPRSFRNISSTGMTESSPPTSPQTATKKRAPRPSAIMSGRIVSGSLNNDTTASSAEALGLPTPTNKGMMEVQRATILRNNGMLPTPAKTPKKAPTDISVGITSIARNLFPVRADTIEEVMPTPRRKGRKKYAGLSLDSFEVEDGETDLIQIYTDSNERIPEIDHSAENPFYGEGCIIQPEPTKRMSKRRKIAIPGEEDQTIEEAEKREDGLIYVFRGKKTFRKFADNEEHEEDGSDSEIDVDRDDSATPRPRGRLTRSSVKPRLLFPTAQQIKAKKMRSQASEDEEEAVTDIEDTVDGSSTPMHQVDEIVMTPKAPRFAPASPPTTTRATRSSTKVDIDSNDDGSPMSQGRSRGRQVSSPFDGWTRTKSVSSQTRKRVGEPIIRGGKEGNKRPRS